MNYFWVEKVDSGRQTERERVTGTEHRPKGGGNIQKAREHGG